MTPQLRVGERGGVVNTRRALRKDGGCEGQGGPKNIMVEGRGERDRDSQGLRVRSMVKHVMGQCGGTWQEGGGGESAMRTGASPWWASMSCAVFTNWGCSPGNCRASDERKHAPPNSTPGPELPVFLAVWERGHNCRIGKDAAGSRKDLCDQHDGHDLRERVAFHR